MKHGTSLFALALLASLLTGCSRHSSTAAIQKNTDLGIVEVSVGVPGSHILADGRVCTIKPTLSKNGNVELAATVVETNTSGVKRLSSVFASPVDTAMTFAFDENTVITLTIHTAKRRPS